MRIIQIIVVGFFVYVLGTMLAHSAEIEKNLHYYEKMEQNMLELSGEYMRCSAFVIVSTAALEALGELDDSTRKEAQVFAEQSITMGVALALPWGKTIQDVATVGTTHVDEMRKEVGEKYENLEKFVSDNAPACQFLHEYPEIAVHSMLPLAGE